MTKPATDPRGPTGRLAGMIDAFARADGPPPDRLGRFMAWALRGAFPAIWATLAVSILVGL
jgi:ATP-binding cassette subfamily B protein